MKIYNKIVINIKTGEIIEEKSYDYSGPVAKCLGGGKTSSSTTTVDTKYNARMAEIAEVNQDYADEMYNMFKYGVTYDPSKGPITPEWERWNKINQDHKARYGIPHPSNPPAKHAPSDEFATQGEQFGYNADDYVSEMSLLQGQIEAEYGLLPDQTALAQEQIGATRELLPQEIAATSAGLGLKKDVSEAGRELLPHQTGIAKSDIALRGERNLASTELLPWETGASKAGLQLSTAQSAAGIDLLPGETALSKGQTAAETELLGQRTSTTRSGLRLNEQQSRTAMELLPYQRVEEMEKIFDRQKTMRERSPVISSFYEDALSGVDPNKRVDQARSDVHQGFTQSEEIGRRNMARMGVDPSSGAGISAFKDVGIQKATALAGASTEARDQAEAENFERKKSAVGLGIGI